MSVAGSPSPPTPAECDHPAPVQGVMAHEYAPYQGARGPEGPRRTTMYYGPVVGGLPIAAWHCERCGLLRLEYPDGRREERRLHPGPQPGLIATAVPGELAPESALGTQMRVSGLTATPDILEEYLVEAEPEGEPREPVLERLRARLPDLGVATWFTVVCFSLCVVGLVLGGVLAIYTWTTPGAMLPLVWTVLALFLAGLVTPPAAAATRRWFASDRLSPSPAVALRGRPQLDGVARLVVGLLTLLVVGLVLGGILAIYDWTTPGAEMPLVVGGVVVFVAALVLQVLGAAVRRLSRQQ
jgi:hypothetical protein